MIKVIQIGLGPLGQKVNQFISSRKNIEIIGAVDKDPALVGKSLGEVCGTEFTHIKIHKSVSEVKNYKDAHVAILTTVSTMEKATPQIEELVNIGLNVVSTCEELSYPWDTAPPLATKLDKLARDKGVTILGTGVNPGFLMDSLPSFLTAVCKDVNFVQVRRFQNAAYRRVPFQKKIGAGLTLEEFDQRKTEGSLRHVGLTESMQFMAAKLGWELDKTEDIIEPVIADKDIKTEGVSIKKGMAAGVKQTGNGYVGGVKKIELIFKAAVGEPESFDEVNIKGEPNISSKIDGGVNGDIATCAITLNALKSAIEAAPGLQTMATVPMVTFNNA